MLAVLRTLQKKKAQKLHQLQSQFQSHNNWLILRVHLKMHLLPSGAEIVEEVEDVFLVKVESVETTLDLGPEGAILNTPVSLMLIVWMLHH